MWPQWPHEALRRRCGAVASAPCTVSLSYKCQVPETDDDGQDILDENGSVVYKMVRWQALALAPVRADAT